MMTLMPWYILGSQAQHRVFILASYVYRECEADEDLTKLVVDIKGADEGAAALLIECRGEDAKSLKVMCFAACCSCIVGLCHSFVHGGLWSVRGQENRCNCNRNLFDHQCHMLYEAFVWCKASCIACDSALQSHSTQPGGGFSQCLE